MGDLSISKIDVNAIYDVRSAAAAVGMGQTFLRAQIKSGALIHYRLGKKNIKIKGRDLQQWFDAQQIELESTGSCPQKKDGWRSGMSQEKESSLVESATASALSDLRQ